MNCLESNLNRFKTNSAFILESLDGVRGLAVLMVFTYHAFVLGNINKLEFFNGKIDLTFLILGGGEFGVTLFFVLSGFLLFIYFGKNYYEGKKINIYEYFKRRIFRIIPLYYLSILLIVTLYQPYFITSINGIKHIIYHLLFIHNFTIDTHGSINGVYWTLAIEMQFYLLLPFIAQFFYGKKNLISAPIFIIISIIYRIFIFYNIGLFGKPVIHNGVNWSIFIFSRQLPGCLDAFVLGITICNIWLYYKNNDKKSILQKYSRILIIISLVSFLILLKVYSDYQIYLHDNRIISFFFYTIIAINFSILILGAAFSNEKTILNNKFLRKVGILGYGIYIWHLIIMQVIMNNNNYLANLSNPNFRFIILILLSGIITIIYSYIFYWLVEIPFINKAKQSNNNISRSRFYENFNNRF